MKQGDSFRVVEEGYDTLLVEDVTKGYPTNKYILIKAEGSADSVRLVVYELKEKILS